jgi:PAS domain S-box-containing protein
MKLITNLSAIQKNLFFGIGFVLFASLVLFINWGLNLPVKQEETLSRQLAHTSQQLQLIGESMNGKGTALVPSMISEIRKDIEICKVSRLVKHNNALKTSLNDELTTLSVFEGNIKDMLLGNEERGDEHAGLVSRWQEASSKLIAASAQHDPEIQKLAESLRKDEMDYLLHGNFNTCEHIQSVVTEIRSKLSQKPNGIQSADLDTYSSLTGDLVALDKRIGSSLVSKTEQSFGALATVNQSVNGQMTERINKDRLLWRIILLVTIALLTICGILFLIRVTSRYITNPLSATAAFVNRIARGEIPEKEMTPEGLPEIRQIGMALNQLIAGLKKKTEFIRSLNKNTLNISLDVEGEHDQIALELNTLRRQLEEASVRQKENDEDNARRRYINEGLARFAEILRMQSSEMDKLGDAFIREIVRYLNAIQGGFFLLNDHEDSGQTLDLVSSFAYNRKKYLQRRLMPGEGLVGTCAREKQIINLTEIPDGYITITSGLGDAKPDNLLLVPVMHEEEVIGVLEIASLNLFREHEIEFAKQVADSLGSTIIYARNNQRTSALLQKTQQQAFEMSEQEEEMRQNMEELKATQEESVRREEQFRGIAEAVNATMMVVKYDLDGLIRDVNDKFCIFTGIPRESILGKTHRSVVDGDFEPDRSFFNELQKNESLTAEEKVKIGKKTHHLKEYFSVVQNKDGSVYQYINFIIETAG